MAAEGAVLPTFGSLFSHFCPSAVPRCFAVSLTFGAVVRMGGMGGMPFGMPGGVPPNMRARQPPAPERVDVIPPKTAVIIRKLTSRQPHSRL